MGRRTSSQVTFCPFLVHPGPSAFTDSAPPVKLDILSIRNAMVLSGSNVDSNAPVHYTLRKILTEHLLSGFSVIKAPMVALS